MTILPTPVPTEDVPKEIRGDWVVYDKRYGGVVKHIAGKVTPYDYDAATQGYFQIPANTEIWANHVNLDTLTLEPKQPLPYTIPVAQGVSDSTTEFVVDGLPVGTIHEGDSIDDGNLELTFDTPGDYDISLTHPAFQPLAITISVVEP